jgi:hypothetical protein
MNTTEQRTVEDYRYFQEHGVFPPVRKTIDQQMKENDVEDAYFILLQQVRNGGAIFIPGNVSSSKNSKEIQQIYTGRSNCCNAPYMKTGNRTYMCTKCNCACDLGKRPILTHSKTVKAYMEDHEKDYLLAKEIWDSWKLEYPVYLGMYHIRNSTRDFDGINAAQIIFDIMVEKKWIPDDNMNYLRHVDIGFHKDAKNAGVIIIPLDIKNNFQLLLWR